MIFCANGNGAYARAAVEAGWLYGARVPGTVYERPFFCDQDWKAPDREGYFAALAKHRPALATVLDLERDEQLPEVLSWAEEAAAHVTEAVLIVPKVVGIIPLLPRRIGGKEVRLAYSVPTSYGGSPVPLWEHGGWPVHLLGGSPQEQMRLRLYLNVVSVDGSMTALQSRKGRTWRRQPGSKGHWCQASDVGNDEAKPALWCFERSLAEIKRTWEDLCQ